MLRCGWSGWLILSCPESAGRMWAGRAVRRRPGPRARFAGAQRRPQDGRGSVTASEPGAKAPASREPGRKRESSHRSREPPVAAARMLISRTWFRILSQWLRRVMSCRVSGRGHRRSWSWPGTAPRTCCAGSSTSGTDPGTPGCPGSSPPGIRSGTAITWSASAPVRCGPWRTRARTRGFRAGCSGVTGRSIRGPRPHPAHQVSHGVPYVRDPGAATRRGCPTNSRLRSTRLTLYRRTEHSPTRV